MNQLRDLEELYGRWSQRAITATVVYLQERSPFELQVDTIVHAWGVVLTKNSLRDVIFTIVVCTYLNTVLCDIRGYGIVGYIKINVRNLSKTIMQRVLKLPGIRDKVEAEVNDGLAKIEHSLIKETGVESFTKIPSIGLPDGEIKQLLASLHDLEHAEWEKGRVSGAVYHGGDDVINIQAEAFKTFCVANQLHPDVFPGVRQMEAEVVAMVLKLFNPPPEAVGGTTSGGTESLLLACLSAKMHAYRTRGVTKPEMVVPDTVHAGFDKAAYYFGIRLHHVPLDPKTFKVDVKRMEAFINSNTVLLAGSAPNFPHGIIDDIEAIGQLGQKYNVPVHVDACLGSFIVSFMAKAGFSLPLFDFRVPGVTSISCDTHKYGFAPKGSSIIMYRNKALRSAQYYVNPDWVGGLYGSPTLAGSRPGALMVGCWATLLKIGEEGYTNLCRDIVNAARVLKKRITEEIDELEVIGDPLCSVVAFTSSTVDIYDLTDLLSKAGWHLSTLQKPPAVHLAVTKPSAQHIDELVDTLKTCVGQLDRNKASKGDTAAVYGVAGSVQTSGVADRLVEGFLDTLYKV